MGMMRHALMDNGNPKIGEVQNTLLLTNLQLPPMYTWYSPALIQVRACQRRNNRDHALGMGEHCAGNGRHQIAMPGTTGMHVLGCRWAMQR
jgi:hypothetical protein